MKLATVKGAKRDGRLIVVSRDLTKACDASSIASSLLDAVERWSEAEPGLQALYADLNAGTVADAFAFDPHACMAPLPRAPQWCDGSAFLNHGSLMQKAFGLDPIQDAETIPLMYQGASDDFLGPHDDIPLPSEDGGIDFEGEFAVVVDTVPMGCTPEKAASHVKLVLQVNDVSLRAYAVREMKTGFGWIQAKPSSGFAPVAVTPDELNGAWRDGRVHLPLTVRWNGERFGSPNGREMNFSFHQLIAHAARTRKLSAGVIVGSGTVSNKDRSAGSACIAERRAIEMIEQGAISTSFMKFGDRVAMDVLGEDGQSIFGAIDQKIVQG